MSSYEPKTFFSFVRCDSPCPTCKNKVPVRFGVPDTYWFMSQGCKRLGTHSSEAHLCFCGKEW